MISESHMETLVKDLRNLVNAEYNPTGLAGQELHDVIDLIPLGWQVANNREDSRVGVALESDDSD